MVRKGKTRVVRSEKEKKIMRRNIKQHQETVGVKCTRGREKRKNEKKKKGVTVWQSRVLTQRGYMLISET